MRKIMLAFIMMTMLQTTSQNEQLLSDELIDIVEVIQSESLIIDEWEIVYRDTISKNKTNSLIQFLHDKNNMTQEKHTDHVLYSAVEKMPKSQMNVTYDLIIPNISYDARFTVTLSGEGWNETFINDLIRQNHNLANQNIKNSPSIFTCLSASDSAIIKNGISMKKISDKFKLLHNFTQFDNNMESKYIGEVYGYNPQWTNRLKIEDDPLNIQIALQQDEEKRNFITIGTPIILSEY